MLGKLWFIKVSCSPLVGYAHDTDNIIIGVTDINFLRIFVVKKPFWMIDSNICKGGIGVISIYPLSGCFYDTNSVHSSGCGLPI